MQTLGERQPQRGPAYKEQGQQPSRWGEHPAQRQIGQQQQRCGQQNGGPSGANQQLQRGERCLVGDPLLHRAPIPVKRSRGLGAKGGVLSQEGGCPDIHDCHARMFDLVGASPVLVGQGMVEIPRACQPFGLVRADSQRQPGQAWKQNQTKQHGSAQQFGGWPVHTIGCPDGTLQKFEP